MRACGTPPPTPVYVLRLVTWSYSTTWMYSSVSMSKRVELSPGRPLGSTLMILRSRLFLNSRPASLSAITWKLGVGLLVEVCVSQ